MAMTATGNYTSLEDTGYTRDDLTKFFADLAAQYHVTVEASDVNALAAKLMGGSGYIAALGGDPQLAFQEFRDQYARRGASGTGGSGPSSETLSMGTPIPKQAISVPEAIRRASPPLGSVATFGPAGMLDTGPTGGPTGLMTPAVLGGGGSNLIVWIVLAAVAAGAIYFLVVKR